MIHAHGELARVVQMPEVGALVLAPVEPPAVDDAFVVGRIGVTCVHVFRAGELGGFALFRHCPKWWCAGRRGRRRGWRGLRGRCAAVIDEVAVGRAAEGYRWVVHAH